MLAPDRPRCQRARSPAPGGVAHFWFVPLHPFDDGSGRLTRALHRIDRVLAKARFWQAHRGQALSAVRRLSERHDIALHVETDGARTVARLGLG